MNAIKQLFEAKKAVSDKVLVTYHTMGFPSLEASIEGAVAAAENGADLLELGVPYSDPVADGPVIAAASADVIASGVSFSDILGAIAEIRKRTDVPLVLFTYYNPVFVYGESELVAASKEAGIDGILVVDLPPEEGPELRKAAKAADICIVPLLTPVSSDDRIKLAASQADGFIYYVSVTGTTGAKAAPLEEACEQAARLSRQTTKPVVVGFGIDSPEKARQAAGDATGPQGVVVGTALIRKLSKEASPSENSAAVGAFVKGLSTGLRG